MSDTDDMTTPPAQTEGALHNFLSETEGRLDGYLDRTTSDAIRARQKARARVMAIILFALAILFFAITIAKTVGPS